MFLIEVSIQQRAAAIDGLKAVCQGPQKYSRGPGFRLHTYIILAI